MTSAASIAQLLRARGVSHGDRVGLFVPLDVIAEAFAAVRACGAIAVPLALRLGAQPLAYHLRDAGVSVLLTDETHLETATQASALAPSCHHVLTLTPRSVGLPEIASAHDPRDDEAAFFSYAPETRGGRPRGAIHDTRATQMAIEGMCDALDLRADDEVAIEIPIWEGGFVLALAAHRAGARVIGRASSSTTVIALRARETTTRLAGLVAGSQLRAAIAVGAGAFGVGAARELAGRGERLELASARVIRELPLW
ncbi:MAG: AMP-binding protein, partial [Deltaproteobacteria bacterium]|nr:AMP-binding protein [Deltaproteobacteria bacterium]